ncbi:MAG: aldose epimerase family protein [Candidatus Limnocylindrales bacterium]
MSARVTEGWSLRGNPALILENAALRVTVLPELGGHVLDLVDKALDRNLLWENPRTVPRQAPYGAHFDDWWSGGWDEIFPSGDRAKLHGEELPYMGELWSVPWTAETGAAAGAAGGAKGGRAWITAAGLATMAPARLERTLELRDDEPVLRARYRLTNLDVRPLPFLWGIHPSFSVTRAHRIDAAAREMRIGVSSGPTMGAVGTTYRWPAQPDPLSASGTRDVRRVLPASEAVFGGHWATDLEAGWLALTDTAARRGIAIAFPVDVFPHAWLWQVYGGWRGHHHVCLEPWTGHPMQLEEAQAAGRARTLEPGESLGAEVAFILFSGLDAVATVERQADGFLVR